MTEPTPINPKKQSLNDIKDALDTKLRDAHSVADLLSEVPQNDVDCNAAGYCLMRLIEDAQKISEQIDKRPGGAA